MVTNEHLEDADNEFELSSDVLAMIAEIKAKNDAPLDENENTANSKTEIWSMSQFWYTKDTSDKLCEEILELAKSFNGPVKVAFLSCPTIFEALEKKKEVSFELYTHLYEFDTRFGEAHPNFTFYDYNDPLEVPAAHRNLFDIIVVDPPHLSDECAVKYAQTMRVLAKEKDSPIIYCTAAKMEEIVKKLFNVRMTNFHPEHNSKLGNIFCCYTNYEPKTFQWDEE
ncbi:unnamed protein product [Bursaphelenchus xylophilus]|uniref:Protein-lysine N-methyltransferase BXYJ_LOCUS473 n=1 Tax=Bursaphelenchus xylophilus TaxID=6326 RepID=A0A1I7RII3_BURXY|nr:unnamed protein product [Bursaphelenchus xylophilus]CAG9080728.1 unnamed protein product [Bursaphelenchus xylophilus]